MRPGLFTEPGKFELFELSTDFIGGVFVDFATFGSGRRRTAACLVSYGFFAGHDEAGCAPGGYSHVRDGSLSCFASSHHPTIGKLWFWLCGAALALGPHLNHSGTTGVTAVGLGNLVAFFRHLSPLSVVTTLNRSSSVSVLR